MTKFRVFPILLAVIVLISNLMIPVSAEENDNKSNETITEYFDDGSYAIITIIEEDNNSRATTKSGTKAYTYYSSDDEAQWTYKITGTFSYTGSSATCTAVSDSYTIINDSWHMSSHSCSKSGNTASGTVTMKYKVLGITTSTVSRNLTLTCSSTGVLS